MFKTGDILVCEFGYNCHLVNFYEVVGVTKSGQSVRIRNLKEKFVSHDGYGQAGKVVPEMVTDDSYNKTKRILEGYQGRPYVKIDQGMYAYKWDGQPVTYDSYD